MSDRPTREDVLKSIVPDSTQINAEDFVTGPMTVTIDRVTKGSRDQPINVHLVGHDRVFRPCKSMRRVLIATFSDDPKAWIGQRMTLFCDPSIMWAGVRVGGVRISHLSGIDEPKTYILTQTRGKKAEVTILPLPAASNADKAYIDDALSEIARADTLEALKAIGFILKGKSVAVQDALRPAYASKQKELSSEATETNE